MTADGERDDPLIPVVAVVTHDNLPDLRMLVPSLQAQAESLGWRFVVVDCASTSETKAWLDAQRPPVPTITIDSNVGLGAARNAVATRYGEADSYFFFDDDVISHGHELASLFSALHADAHIAIATGIPLDENSTPMAADFSRRPLARVFPGPWDHWWGKGHGGPETPIRWADVAPLSAAAIRGIPFREVRGYDPEFWPAGFEDLDLCAKVLFSGYRVAVDPRAPIRQHVSVTMNKVFGAQYPVLRRSSGVLYALVDYPLPFAIGRWVRTFVGVVAQYRNALRRGDAAGILRGAREWRYVLRARRFRRKLRAARDRRARETGS